MIAYLTNASKADSHFGTYKFFVVFVNRDAGETYGEALAKRNRLFARDKREARAICKLNNATPWNF